MANPEHLYILEQGVEVWNNWREENQSVEPNLFGASLISANLFRANLSEANLRGALLIRARLMRANLRHAVLSGASLIGANLIGANLSGADLGGANLSGAAVGWTVFNAMDLSSVKGLAEVHHQGPSTLGVDTLWASKGKIPDTFLRGCGVPESLIGYLPDLIGVGIEFYSCFISYSHTDRDFACKLHASLHQQGIRCWLDEHQMLPGDDPYERIEHGIRIWDKVLLCCSEASLTSWWVDKEITTAFDKEQRLMRERGRKVLALIPLDLDGFLYKWTGGKATEVRTRIAADFTGWQTGKGKFEGQAARLMQALMVGESGREKPPQPKL